MLKKSKNSIQKKAAKEEEFQQARREIKKMLAKEKSELADPAEEEKPVEEDQAEVKIEVENSVVEEEQPELTSTPKASKKERNFSSFYNSAKGNQDDLSKIDRRDPNRRKKIVALVIFILIILAGITVGGFYFFVNNQGTFTGDQISIRLTSPQTVKSGDEAQYIIQIENNEEIDIKNAELTIQWPSEFSYASSNPSALNEAHNAWSVGDIASGAAKQILVSGQMVGSIGKIVNFSTILSYMPANFNSEFQTNASFSVTIKDSTMDLNLEAPVNAVSEQEVEYRVAFTNNSSEVLDRARLTLGLPEGFIASNFNISSDKEDNIWEITSLGSGEEFEITWTGVIEGSEGEMKEITAEVGYLDESGRYIEQAKESSIIFIINPELILKMTLNESSEEGAVSFGETLDYTIFYSNESQSVINNLTIQAILEGDIFNWARLVDSNDGEVDQNTITWNQELINDLEVVNPGDEGEISFSISLADNTLAKESTDINYTISSQVRANSSEVTELEGAQLEVESKSITTKINSRVDLRSEGRYYNDEYIPVGEGPLPPEAGQTTTYQIYWFIQNNINEVTDVSITAQLPKGVTWADDYSISAGVLDYDRSSRTVTWTINKIPPHVGQLIPELEIRFGVKVKPTTSDIGKLLVLLGKSQLSAVDTFTLETLSQDQDIITTDLINDPLGSGKAEVVKPSINSNTNTSVNTNSSNSNTNTTE